MRIYWNILVFVFRERIYFNRFWKSWKRGSSFFKNFPKHHKKFLNGSHPKKMSRSIMRKNNKYNVWRLLLLRIQSSINNYRSKASISICLGITWGLSKSLYSVWLWESSIYDEDHRFSFVSINKEHNKKRAFIFDFTNMVQQHLT